MSGKFPYSVAVLGDSSIMTDQELWRLLDLLVNRHVGEKDIVLLSGRDCPREAGRWAAHHHHSIILAGGLGHPVKSVCDIVRVADAVVVLGDPAPYRLLVWLCEQAGTPVRVYRTRPRLPTPPRAAWEIDDEPL